MINKRSLKYIQRAGIDLFDGLQKLQVLARQFFLVTALTAFANASGYTEEMAWSFETHPNPEYEDLSEDERFFIKLHSDRFSGKMGRCMAHILATYEIYLRRYPEFQETGDAMDNFKRWKRHIADENQFLRSDCLHLYPALKLYTFAVQPFVRNDFYYCGLFSRKAFTPLEHEARLLIEELVYYANTNEWLTIAPLIRDHEEGKIIDLNPDVEYYFRKLMLPVPKEYEKYTDVSHLIPQLSPERLAFLEDAIAKRDYHAVATSTKPCKPRPPGRPRF